METNRDRPFKFLWQFTNRIEAYRGIRAGIALAVPTLVGRAVGYPETGFYIGLTGVFFILGAVGGPYGTRAKTAIATLVGGTVAIGLGTLVSAIAAVKLLATFLWMFAVGYAAIYGHPGVMAGIVSGILFLFTIHLPPGDLAVAAERSAVGFAGGIWAIALWLILWPLRPYLPLRKAISRCYGAIADYIQFVLNHSPGDEIRGVAQWRETLQIAKDAYILNRRGRRGNSAIGQAAVMLIQDAERLMMSVSALIEVAAIHRDHPQQMTVGVLVDNALEKIASNLRNLAKLTRNQPARIDGDRLRQISEALNQQKDLQQRTIGDRVEAYSGLIAVDRLVNILNRTICLLDRSAHILWEMKPTAGGEPSESSPGETVLLEPTKTPPFEPLRDNFTFNSAYFRHGVRLAVATSAGVAIATLEAIPHGFWISLTVLLVLQPDFGSTYRRFFHRILGTILGALLTPLLAIAIPQTYILEAIAVISVSVAFSLLRFNYGLAVFFITVYAVLLEQLRSAEDVRAATVRVVATLIGSGLAFAAAFFLFRDREEKRFLAAVATAIAAGRHYFKTVMTSYFGDREIDPDAIARCRHQNRLAQFNAQVSLQKLIDDPHTSQNQIEMGVMLMLNLTRFSRAIAVLIDPLNHFTGTEPHPDIETFVSHVDFALEQLEIAIKIKKHPPPLPDLQTPLMDFKTHFETLQKTRLEELTARQERTPTRQVLLDYSIVSLELEEMADYLQDMFRAIGEFTQSS
ncbi:FUSC family protein [Lyngbya sp. CCY1209]|uniref:FUSC family protein n=1 Tax=Lyngbya sp. CCY1209 TaxID=2886103 RepID=UPI002D217D4A|nr:FUSC family protein [Lyngbya sp. CCY1209]MEB3882130.1 FUSC family protein [Lyngbya sp. CCY1209]